MKANKETLNKILSILTTIFIIIAGISSGFGIFYALRNSYETKRINGLIPSAKEALSHEEYNKAINLFVMAEKEFPNDVDVKRNLAEIYYQKGLYDDSLKYYDLIKVENWNKKDIHNIGDIYYKNKNFDKVIELWSGKEITPQDTFLLAQVYYSKENTQKYIEELNKIQTYLEPVVLVQINEKDLNKIISNIDTALTLTRLSDKKLDAESFKTNIVEAKKQLDLGKRDFSELIQISAYYDLEQCKLLPERIKNLRTNFTNQRIPTFQIDYYEGACYNQMEKPDMAIPLLDQAVKYDPTILEYHEALAYSYYFKRDLNKVKEVYDKILTIKKEAKHYENLAEYEYFLEDKDAALQDYEEALKLYTTPEDKERSALNIIKKNLLDKKNLEICKRNDLIDLITIKTLENSMIVGHCKIYNGQDMNDFKYIGALDKQYFTALKDKNRNEIDKVLDKDLSGFVLKYFNVVGVELLKSK